MKGEYKVSKHNSTVCGYPGRDFDWSNFDWKQKTVHDFGDMRYSNESEYIPDELKGKRIGIKRAPQVFKDDCLIASNCEYLHVPYNWAENGTVFRVRPNDSMYAGEIYRGHLVKSVNVVEKEDGWYWVLELGI